MNARDAPIVGVVRRHRMIRRSTNYGPELPGGVLEDDGADRGILFTCIVADLDRQFEFVQTNWLNRSEFAGQAGARLDPVTGAHAGRLGELHQEAPHRRCADGRRRGQPIRRRAGLP